MGGSAPCACVIFSLFTVGYKPPPETVNCQKTKQKQKPQFTAKYKNIKIKQKAHKTEMLTTDAEIMHLHFLYPFNSFCLTKRTPDKLALSCHSIAFSHFTLSCPISDTKFHFADRKCSLANQLLQITCSNGILDSFPLLLTIHTSQVHSFSKSAAGRRADMLSFSKAKELTLYGEWEITTCSLESLSYSQGTERGVRARGKAPLPASSYTGAEDDISSSG